MIIQVANELYTHNKAITYISEHTQSTASAERRY